MTLENTIYNSLKKYVDDNKGFGLDIRKTEIWKKYLSFMDKLISLEGKTLKISYTTSNYIGSSESEKLGKIKVGKNKEIMFFERGFRRRHYYLDAGLYEGWHATIVPLRIEILKKFPKRKKKSIAEIYGLCVPK